VVGIDQTVYGGKGTRVVLGKEASEQLVKQLSASGELAQQQVVHFACHGIFEADYPDHSAVVLSKVGGALKGISEEDNPVSDGGRGGASENEGGYGGAVGL
jgi:CHAT domain-containing protein